MWGFFKASIYFYLFEDFSVVLSIVVFSIGILPGPGGKKKKKKRLHMMTEKHIPKRFQMPTLWGQILSLDVPPFT